MGFRRGLQVGLLLAPTQARPGSEEKVQALEARYAQGQPLWHNGDFSGDDEE